MALEAGDRANQGGNAERMSGVGKRKAGEMKNSMLFISALLCFAVFCVSRKKSVVL